MWWLTYLLVERRVEESVWWWLVLESRVKGVLIVLLVEIARLRDLTPTLVNAPPDLLHVVVDLINLLLDCVEPLINSQIALP